MCGRFNLTDSPEIEHFCETMRIELLEHHKGPDITPGSAIAIVHSSGNIRKASLATWWLLLEDKTLLPNYRYASFNSRSDKLFTKGSASYIPFRKSRCIIPASEFIEGLGDKKTYYKIELEQSAIAFGGVFKEYINRKTGEKIYSASIITCPPLTAAWKGIHPKSMPLMIDITNQELVNAWLDTSFYDVEKFESLFERKRTRRMKVTQIDRPSKCNPIAKSFIVEA